MKLKKIIFIYEDIEGYMDCEALPDIFEKLEYELKRHIVFKDNKKVKDKIIEIYEIKENVDFDFE